jgi:hypothetical protein
VKRGNGRVSFSMAGGPISTGRKKLGHLDVFSCRLAPRLDSRPKTNVDTVSKLVWRLGQCVQVPERPSISYQTCLAPKSVQVSKFLRVNGIRGS